MKPSLKGLLPDTLSVLTKLTSFTFLKDYTLIGGTALAIHLQHRLSEDLDWFTWKEWQMQDKEMILDLNRNFQKFELLNISDKQIDLILDGIKLSFCSHPKQAILLQERDLLLGNVYIGKVEILAAFKFFTLLLRAKKRDYYDLYAICKSGVSINAIFDYCNRYLGELDLRKFKQYLTFTQDVMDEDLAYLKPKYKISTERISKFFINEINKKM